METKHLVVRKETHRKLQKIAFESDQKINKMVDCTLSKLADEQPAFFWPKMNVNVYKNK